MKITKKAFKAIFLSTVICTQVYAADIIIKNATVFDGTGSDLIKNANVVIENGKVKAIQTGKVQEKAKQIIDAKGKTVMPGLINAHLHLFWDFYDMPPQMPAKSEATAQSFIDGDLTARLRGHLEHGFTSTFSPIDFQPYIYQVRDRIEKGEIIGPRIIAAGPVLLNAGSYYACGDLKDEELKWCNDHVRLPMDTPEQARASVQELAKNKSDVVVFDGVTNQTEMSQDVVKTIVEEAHKHNLKVLVHNTNAKDVNMMLDAGVDGFIHPPTVTKDIDGTLLKRLGEEQKPIAVTLGFLERYIKLGYASDKDKNDYNILEHNVKVMLKAGAVPLFTSDIPGIPPQQVVPLVTHVMKGEGIDNKTILLSATSSAAKALGQDNLGTLETGKIADLIMIDGNPIQDISSLQNIELVMKDGVIVTNYIGQKIKPAKVDWLNQPIK